jgi:hypothetical protein
MVEERLKAASKDAIAEKKARMLKERLQAKLAGADEKTRIVPRKPLAPDEKSQSMPEKTGTATAAASAGDRKSPGSVADRFREMLGQVSRPDAESELVTATTWVDEKARAVGGKLQAAPKTSTPGDKSPTATNKPLAPDEKSQAAPKASTPDDKSPTATNKPLARDEKSQVAPAKAGSIELEVAPQHREVFLAHKIAQRYLDTLMNLREDDTAEQIKQAHAVLQDGANQAKIEAQYFFDYHRDEKLSGGQERETMRPRHPLALYYAELRSELMKYLGGAHDAYDQTRIIAFQIAVKAIMKKYKVDDLGARIKKRPVLPAIVEVDANEEA